MSYQSTILADTPIRYYRGSTLDLGSQAQNGTTVGSTLIGPPLLPADNIQSSLNFGGSGYITIPTTGLPTGANAWSMECWLKWPTGNGPSGFDEPMGMGTVGVTAEQVAIFVDTGSSNAIDGGFQGLTNIVSGQLVVLNQLFYVVLTYNGTNGIIDVFSTSGHFSASNAESVNLVYGGASFGARSDGSLVFHGLGQEFAWYNYALSAAQKSNHYTVGSTPNIVGPIAWSGGNAAQLVSQGLGIIIGTG